MTHHFREHGTPFLRKFIPLILLMTASFSSYATKVDYQSALSLYKNQSYSEAYNAFLKLVESDYSSIDYNFYFARTASLLNKTGEAISAYERILIINPSHTRTKLELGKLYFEQGDMTQAKIYFNSAKSEALPEAVQNNINRYMVKIDQKTKQSFLTGALIFGAGYDTNINVAPDASSWFVPGYGDFNNTSDNLKSLYNQQVGIINHYYNASSQLGFNVKNSLLAFNKSVPGESEYNIQYLRYQPALIFNYETHKIETGLHFDTMRYGGDAYIESYGFKPILSHQLNASSLIRVQAKLLVKNYLQSKNQERDARYNELGLTYSKQLNSQTIWHATMELAQERQEKSSLLDVSNNMLLIKSGVSYKYSPSLRMSGELQYSKKHYLDNNPYFLTKREDDYLKATLDVSKKVTKDLGIQFTAEHTVNESNQNAYSYNKNVLLINMIKEF